MKKKHLLIVLVVAVFASTLSGCYCERYHTHYYHYR
jgi:hypothetical protein